MLIVVARWTLNEDSLDEAGQLLLELQKQTQDEPGNIRYDIYRKVSAPAEVLLYEQYVNRAAFEEHRASPHFQNIAVEKILPILANRTVDIFENE